MAAGDYQGSYYADKVVMTIGATILSGTDDGDFVSAEYSEDRATIKVGADGEFSYSINPSKAGEITFTLSATSAANDELSTMFNLGNFAGVSSPVPISIVDLSGRTVIAATKCTLKSAPNVSFGKEVGSREWVFLAGDLTMFAGGNG